MPRQVETSQDMSGQVESSRDTSKQTHQIPFLILKYFPREENHLLIPKAGKCKQKYYDVNLLLMKMIRQ